MFPNNEINELNFQILEFVLPRLKQFEKLTTNYPSSMTFKEWKDILSKMILEIEESFKTEDIHVPLFLKHFNALWI